MDKINTILAHKLINKTAVAVALYPHLKNTSAWGKLAQKLDKGNPYELTDQEQQKIIADLQGLADFINTLIPRDGEAENLPPNQKVTGLGRTAADDLKHINPTLAKLLAGS